MCIAIELLLLLCYTMCTATELLLLLCYTMCTAAAVLYTYLLSAYDDSRV